MKISLAMIVKDEEKVLDRCLMSAAPYVDEIIIVDTGSTDKTKRIAKKYKAKVFDFKWVDDFSAARNFSFSKATGDWILWLDADDVLLKGAEIKKLINNTPNDVDAIQMKYYYEVDKHGNVLVEHWKDRLIRNTNKMDWVGRLHENPRYLGDYRLVRTEDLGVLHLTDFRRRKRRKDQNIKILKEQLKSEGDTPDPRTLFYLGNSYWADEQWEKSITYYEQYLTLSGWDEERYQALISMAKVYISKEQPDKAVDAGLRAIKEKSDYPGGYFVIAEAYFHKEDHEKVIEWTEMGLKKKVPYDSQILINPRDYDLKPLTFMADSLYELGKFEEAIASIDKCLEIQKDEEFLLERKKKYEEMLNHKEVTNGINSIYKYLYSHGQKKKIPLFLSTLPQEHKDIPLVNKIRKVINETKIWEEDEITIYAGSVWEIWSPKTLKDGLGGSEEAVVHVAKQLQELGWRVTVYANCFDEAGTYDGVVYKNYTEFNRKDYFNILVDWRSLDLVKMPVAANKVYIWMHDVPNQYEFTKARVSRVEKIIALSKYHRSLLPNVPDDKFFISTNGILPEDFQKPVKRDPYKLIYTSSYDRGLEHLLSIWPNIKKAVPKATLDIYYGWTLFDWGYKDNPERMKWKQEMSEAIRELDGVEEHGRIGHDKLADKMLGAGIFAYPSHFEEISCISAMKAQASGAYPVVTNFAALKETVDWGTKVSVDIRTKEGKIKYADELITALQNPPTEEERQKQMKIAQDKFSWDKVATKWDKEFISPVTNKRPKISVCTITIRPGIFATTVKTLQEQTFKDFEWVIVDDLWDQRKDEVREYMKDKGIKYKHVPSKYNPRPYGIANANNTAIHEAEGDLLVWLQDFIEMPKDGLQRYWDLYEEKGNCLFTGVDDRVNTTKPVDTEDKIDIFKGKGYKILNTDWQNKRVYSKGQWKTTNPYDFEMNYAAIPAYLIHDMGGFFEEFDEGFGYDNTQIALRAMVLGYEIWVDSSNKCHALNHWNWYPGDHKHNVIGRGKANAENKDRYESLIEELGKAGANPKQYLPYYDKREELKEYEKEVQST